MWHLYTYTGSGYIANCVQSWESGSNKYRHICSINQSACWGNMFGVFFKKKKICQDVSQVIFALTPRIMTLILHSVDSEKPQKNRFGSILTWQRHTVPADLLAHVHDENLPIQHMTMTVKVICVECHVQETTERWSQFCDMLLCYYVPHVFWIFAAVVPGLSWKWDF